VKTDSFAHWCLFPTAMLGRYRVPRPLSGLTFTMLKLPHARGDLSATSVLLGHCVQCRRNAPGCE
jgi:hypothetical protein